MKSPKKNTTQTILYTITCGCKKKKNFKHTIEVIIKKSATGGYTQIKCPFYHEKECVQNLTIELPPGTQQVMNEKIVRG